MKFWAACWLCVAFTGSEVHVRDDHQRSLTGYHRDFAKSVSYVHLYSEHRHYPDALAPAYRVSIE